MFLELGNKMFAFNFLFAVHQGSWNAIFHVLGWIWRLRDVSISIDQFRYIKIQPKTRELNTRPWGINTEFVGFIPQSLVLRSIVFGWILIYRNWSFTFGTRANNYRKTICWVGMTNITSFWLLISLWYKLNNSVDKYVLCIPYTGLLIWTLNSLVQVRS